MLAAEELLLLLEVDGGSAAAAAATTTERDPYIQYLISGLPYAHSLYVPLS